MTDLTTKNVQCETFQKYMSENLMVVKNTRCTYNIHICCTVNFHNLIFLQDKVRVATEKEKERVI